MAKRNDSDKVSRLTYPTSAFTILKSQQDWIADEAKRIGVSKSEFVRMTISAVMKAQKESQK